MKLRNKKTGEIGYLIVGKGVDHYVVADDNWNACGKYKSLAELNEEWEDVPEKPKEWFLINWFDGSVKKIADDSYAWTDEEKKNIAELGLKFKTKEEAEKAVEKLKAFKRLKDKGFKFTSYGCYDIDGGKFPHIDFSYPNFDDLLDDDEVVADLDLLFVGDEE